MRYTQEIILDLNPNSAPPIVYAKQGDVDSRGLTIYITENQKNYDLVSNGVLSTQMRIQKPDGETIVFACSEPVAGSNIINAVFDEQSLLVPGRATAALVLLGTNSQVLSTINFIIKIQPTPQAMRTVESESEIAVFSSMLDQALSIIGSAQAWAVGNNPSSAYESASDSNNAKYWADQAAIKASQMTMALGDTIEPGQAPSLTISNENHQYVLKTPSVKYIPDVTTHESSTASVSISISSYNGDPGTGEDSKLLKSLNFDFYLPGSNLPSGAVKTSQLEDDAVTGSKIAPKTLESENYGDYSILAIALSTGAVTEDKIYQNAVTGSKIANNTITDSKFALGAVNVRFSNQSVPTTDWNTSIPEVYEGYPEYAVINLETTLDLSQMQPEVIFGFTEAVSGNFAPIAISNVSSVTIYAKERPTSNITIPMIVLWR